MQQLNVRDLIQYTPDQLWDMLEEIHILIFENGETLQTTNRRTYYSAFTWELHRQYPGVPILPSHHVQTVIGNQPANSSTHIKLLENISKDVIRHHNLILPIQKENILSIIFSATNQIYNKCSPKSEANVIGLDILDFIEVVTNPDIVHLVENIPEDIHPDSSFIEDTYAKVLKIVQTSPALKNNGVTRMVKMKLANNNQILQCVAFKGFQTEVDGKILKEPVRSNFVRGMTRLYDYCAESRSAAKSHYFAEAPLEDAEYFSRRLQLLTVAITHIEYTDCGSQTYLNWIVRGPEKDEYGKEIYSGDLEYLVGQYYLDEETKELKEILGNEKHLENKMIRMRNAIYCKHPNKHAICSVCFGGLSHNVSRFANLGHLCAATMTQKTTQSVLSTKHLDASSKSVVIALTPDQKIFFAQTDRKNSFVFKKEYKSRRLKFVLNRDFAIGLVDAMAFENFDTLIHDRISSIKSIDIHYEDPRSGGNIIFPLIITNDKRRAVFTEDFLSHLKKHGWGTDNNGNFVFDLKDWNYNLPVMKFPEVEYSYSDHSKQIAQMIESKMEMMLERMKPNSPAVTLQELFIKVNEKLDMNLAPLSVIIASTMLPEPGSYGIGRGEPNAVLGIAKRIVKNRSLSNAYAYQEQTDVFLSAGSFFPEDKMDSGFDIFFAPAEVLSELERSK